MSEIAKQYYENTLSTMNKRYTTIKNKKGRDREKECLKVIIESIKIILEDK